MAELSRGARYPGNIGKPGPQRPSCSGNVIAEFGRSGVHPFRGFPLACFGAETAQIRLEPAGSLTEPHTETGCRSGGINGEENSRRVSRSRGLLVFLYPAGRTSSSYTTKHTGGWGIPARKPGWMKPKSTILESVTASVERSWQASGPEIAAHPAPVVFPGRRDQI